MTATVQVGDALTVLRTLPSAAARCVVTSPPYYMQRDYGVAGQIGVEEKPQAYVEALAAIFGEARRVLHPRGTLWLNLGDTYNAYNGNRGEGGRLAHGRRVDAPVGNHLAQAELETRWW